MSTRLSGLLAGLLLPTACKAPESPPSGDKRESASGVEGTREAGERLAALEKGRTQLLH